MRPQSEDSRLVVEWMAIFFDHFPDRECQTNHSNGRQAGVHELVRGNQFAGNLAVSEEKLWFEHQYFATMQLF